MRSEASTLVARPYANEDEPAVLELLESSLGGSPAGYRSAEFFRWKHLENPFGTSFLLIGETNGRIVGLRAFLRWRLRIGDEAVAAVRAVDTATHPQHQGVGVFTRLTRRALEDLRHQIDLVFNTPNAKSLPGYLKMGWRPVGTFRPSVRIRRPGALARVLTDGEPRSSRPEIDAPHAVTALEDLEAVDRLLQAADETDGRLRTDRTAAYLRWRYARAPLLDYRAIVTRSSTDIDGIALFRVRSRAGAWEATVAEVIVPRGDVGEARRLLRGIARSCPVDVLTARFPAGTTGAWAIRRSGFVPAPRGMTLVVNPLRTIGVDPGRSESWALGLGDLEVL